MHTPDEALALYVEHVPEQVRARVDPLLEEWRTDGLHDERAATFICDLVQAAYHDGQPR